MRKKLLPGHVDALQASVEELFHRIPVGEVVLHEFGIAGALAVFVAERGAPLDELRPEERFVFRFPDVRHSLAGKDHVEGLDQHVRFEPLGRRKQDVRVHREGGRVHVHVDDEVALFHRLHPRARVGVDAELVARAFKPDLDRIGLAGEHRVEHGRRLCGVPLQEALVLVAAEALRELPFGEQIRAAGCKRTGGHDVARGVALHKGARTLDVAEERIEDHGAHGGLHGVRGLVGRDAERNARRTVGVDLDGFFDLLRIEPAFLRRCFQGPGFRALLEAAEARLVLLALIFEFAVEFRIERIVPRILDRLRGLRLLVPDDVRALVALRVDFVGVHEHLRLDVDEVRQIRPVHDEVFVVDLLLDDVAHPAEHERNVGARTDREPHVSALGFRNEARIDHDRLHALRAQRHDGLAAARGVAVGRVRAPEHDRLHLRVGVVDFAALFVGDRGVGAAVHHVEGERAGQIALRAARFVEVRRAEGVCDARNAAERGVAAAARRDEDRFGAVLVADLFHLRGDAVNRFLPADAAPLVFTALADADHRVLVAVRVIKGGNAREALRAERALAHRVFGVAFDLHDAAVAHVRENAAVVNAGAAAGLDDFRFACRSAGRGRGFGCMRGRNQAVGRCTTDRSGETDDCCRLKKASARKLHGLDLLSFGSRTSSQNGRLSINLGLGSPARSPCPCANARDTFLSLSRSPNPMPGLRVVRRGSQCRPQRAVCRTRFVSVATILAASFFISTKELAKKFAN